MPEMVVPKSSHDRSCSKKSSPKPDQPSLFLSLLCNWKRWHGHHVWRIRYQVPGLSHGPMHGRGFDEMSQLAVWVQNFELVAAVRTSGCLGSFKVVRGRGSYMSRYLIPGTWYKEPFCHQTGPYQTLRAHTLCTRVWWDFASFLNSKNREIT